MKDIRITGGCQCGAVRYALHSEPSKPAICHCRMCQKQSGSYFGAFTGVNAKDFEVTRGTIAYFQSSDDARRGFCRDCGTPLTYEFLSKPRICPTHGSLDEPWAIEPEIQVGIESRMPWLHKIMDLPASESGNDSFVPGDTPSRFELIRRTNRQHPDHDTEVWPPIEWAER
ncbi:MAG: GFA family protein [Devosia sp.]